jgi:hypothetical protein
VAEYHPEKIILLVYITAFLVAIGKPMLQVGKDSLLMPNVILAEDQSYTTVRADAIKEIFYHDCSDEDVALAKLLLVPQAKVSPTLSNTTEQKFGRIPRVYIECLQDKTITASRQKEMYTRLPCQKVISMNTSHSPFLSAFAELASDNIDFPSADHYFAPPLIIDHNQDLVLVEVIRPLLHMNIPSSAAAIDVMFKSVRLSIKRQLFPLSWFLYSPRPVSAYGSFVLSGFCMNSII